MSQRRVRPSLERLPYIITAGGSARSGKGTSMAFLKGTLEADGKKVTNIDQGGKFRTMAVAALDAHIALDDPHAVERFLRTSNRPILRLLSAVATLDDAKRKELLYPSHVGEASAKIARVPDSHPIAIGLLEDEVKEAVDNQADVILIDGRAMHGHAKRIAGAGLGRHVLSWHFECDSFEAARRSMSMFGSKEEVGPDDWERLLAEEAKIIERNQTDMDREVDPLRRPEIAYELSLPVEDSMISEHTAVDGAFANDRMVTLDTTHVGRDDMTHVVAGISTAALWREDYGLVFGREIEHVR